MIDIKMYKPDSYPLQVVTNPEIGDIGYTSKGDCFKVYNKENGVSKWEQVHDSELHPVYYLEDLKKEDVIKLFWTLSKNRRKNHVGFKYTD